MGDRTADLDARPMRGSAGATLATDAVVDAGESEKAPVVPTNISAIPRPAVTAAFPTVIAGRSNG
jgi:hypothetical protein